MRVLSASKITYSYLNETALIKLSVSSLLASVSSKIKKSEGRAKNPDPSFAKIAYVLSNNFILQLLIYSEIFIISILSHPNGTNE